MNTSTATPQQLGYRMPAEWEPHAATWLSWPRPNGASFPGRYAEVLPALGALARAIAPHEPVNITCQSDAVETLARQNIGAIANVRYHRIASDEAWCRDHGPTFVVRPGNVGIVDWRFNAWGGKYTPWADDDAVPARIAGILGCPLFQPPLVLEGGSIDVNGGGLLLTTEACLLNKNRNPHLDKNQIEEFLKNQLGVTQIIWLGTGLVGDDTDGHVDDMTRFVSPTTVVTAVESDPHDENYPALQDNLNRLRHLKSIDRIVELPMPAAVVQQGKRLPASYANFYIANGVVILPTYRQPVADRRAQAILQDLFPTRRVEPLDSTEVIWGRGSFHCLTQQQPKV